jgi:hypothetical protein
MLLKIMASAEPITFAFFVEVATVDVVHDRDGEVLHLHIL